MLWNVKSWIVYYVLAYVITEKAITESELQPINRNATKLGYLHLLFGLQLTKCIMRNYISTMLAGDQIYCGSNKNCAANRQMRNLGIQSVFTTRTFKIPSDAMENNCDIQFVLKVRS